MKKNTLKAFAFGLMLVVGSMASAHLSVISAAQAAEWYEGGTLHQASALEWQQATQANKLATAADITTNAYNKQMFKPELHNLITGVNSFLPMAHALVVGMDKAFKADPDPETNRKTFANQKVSETMVLWMATQGWLK